MTPIPTPEQVAEFEEAVFLQRFMASIGPVEPGSFGAVGMPLGMSKDCPTKAELLERDASGNYKDKFVSAMWWGWSHALAAASRVQKVITDPAERDRVLTCAFCGLTYPEGTPTHKHEALTAHIRECPRHPVGGENRVMRTMLGDFYARAKEIEDRIRLPVDGPPPITLVRHVISQYETIIKQALDAGRGET